MDVNGTSFRRFAEGPKTFDWLLVEGSSLGGNVLYVVMGDSGIRVIDILGQGTGYIYLINIIVNK